MKRSRRRAGRGQKWRRRREGKREIGKEVERKRRKRGEKMKGRKEGKVRRKW